jgi:hypothetical protein
MESNLPDGSESESRFKSIAELSDDANSTLRERSSVLRQPQCFELDPFEPLTRFYKILIFGRDFAL